MGGDYSYGYRPIQGEIGAEGTTAAERYKAEPQPSGRDSK